MFQSSGRLVASRCYGRSTTSSFTTTFKCSPFQTREQRKFSDHDRDDKEPQNEVKEGLSTQQLRRQLELYSPLDVYRRTFLRVHATNRALQINANVKKNNLSPRSLDWNWERDDRHGYAYQRKRLVSHRRMNLAMDLFREQLHACSNAQDVVRVMTTAFQDEETARIFASDHLQYRALAKLRLGKNPGLVLEALSAFHRRFQEKGLEMHTDLAVLGLECAAKTLHYTAMRHWLRTLGTRLHSTHALMTHANMRKVLQTLSEAVKTAEHVNYAALLALPFCSKNDVGDLTEAFKPLTVLKHQSLLESFGYYMDILVRFKLKAYVRSEWCKWCASPNGVALESSYAARKLPVNAAVRLIFLKAFFKLNLPDEAWAILSKFGDRLDLDEEAWSLILDNLDTMPKLDTSLVKEHEGSLLNMLQAKLEELEHDLGLWWVPNEAAPGESRHVMFREGEETEEHEEWLEGLLSSSDDSDSSAEDNEELPSYSEDPYWREYLERQNTEKTDQG